MTMAKTIALNGMIGLGLVAAFLLGGCRASTSPAEEANRTSAFQVRQVGLVANPALVESSGMAASRRDDDLLWMVNDGGHPAVLYAMGADGRDRGQVAVEGAVNTDWEDLAAFEEAGQPYILIADVGDNKAVRDTSRIYVVAEPLRRSAGGFPRHAAVAWQFDFRYEDGPRDCEGVGVDTRSGMILLITKRTTPPQVYRLPLKPRPDTLTTARRVATVPRIPPPTAHDLAADPRFGALRSQPTALDIRRDNRLAVVLTYKDAYLFVRQTSESWTTALARTPLTIILPELKQKESGCLTPDGRRLYVSTEQRPTPLLVVNLLPIF